MKNLMILCVLIAVLVGCAPKQQKNSLDLRELSAKLDTLVGDLPLPETLNVQGMALVPIDFMWKAFDENPLNANANFAGQWYKMQGVLVGGPEKTKISELNLYVITLEENGKRMDFVLWGQKKEEELKKLRKGQKLTVVGKYIENSKKLQLWACRIINVE